MLTVVFVDLTILVTFTEYYAFKTEMGCWDKISSFYPTVLMGCWGIVFTHGVRMGGQAAGKYLSGLYLRNHKV